MNAQNYIKIEPQPKGLEHLWPNDSSHIEWQDVIEDPEYYFECWQVGTLQDNESITIKEEDNIWYWVINDANLA